MHAIASQMNAIHNRIRGTLREAAGVFPAGTPYSARDPELLRWVYATMVDLSPLAYELFVGPLTRQEKDRYCAEAAMIAPLLGIPDGLLPCSLAERLTAIGLLPSDIRQSYFPGMVTMMTHLVAS